MYLFRRGREHDVEHTTSICHSVSDGLDKAVLQIPSDRPFHVARFFDNLFQC
jgi:hypothetical protein